MRKTEEKINSLAAGSLSIWTAKLLQIWCIFLSPIEFSRHFLKRFVFVPFFSQAVLLTRGF
jgi:hypothetical protein